MKGNTSLFACGNTFFSTSTWLRTNLFILERLNIASWSKQKQLQSKEMKVSLSSSPPSISQSRNSADSSELLLSFSKLKTSYWLISNSKTDLTTQPTSRQLVPTWSLESTPANPLKLTLLNLPPILAAWILMDKSPNQTLKRLYWVLLRKIWFWRRSMERSQYSVSSRWVRT